MNFSFAPLHSKLSFSFFLFSFLSLCLCLYLCLRPSFLLSFFLSFTAPQNYTTFYGPYSPPGSNLFLFLCLCAFFTFTFPFSLSLSLFVSVSVPLSVHFSFSSSFPLYLILFFVFFLFVPSPLRKSLIPSLPGGEPSESGGVTQKSCTPVHSRESEGDERENSSTHQVASREWQLPLL